MEPENPSLKLEEEIHRRAFELYERRGREPGHDVEDWLQAEEEIKEIRALSTAVRTTDRSATSQVRRVRSASVAAFAGST